QCSSGASGSTRQMPRSRSAHRLAWSRLGTSAGSVTSWPTAPRPWPARAGRRPGRSARAASGRAGWSLFGPNRLASAAREGSGSTERHDLAPARDPRREAEGLDLRLHHDLGPRIAVDEEDRSGDAGDARPTTVDKVPEPVEQSALVGMRAEAADRADLAADLPDPPVQHDRRRAGLEMGAQRALALVPDEQERRGRIVDQVPQVAQDPPAGQHP